MSCDYYAIDEIADIPLYRLLACGLQSDKENNQTESSTICSTLLHTQQTNWSQKLRSKKGYWHATYLISVCVYPALCPCPLTDPLLAALCPGHLDPLVPNPLTSAPGPEWHYSSAASVQSDEGACHADGRDRGCRVCWPFERKNSFSVFQLQIFTLVYNLTVKVAPNCKPVPGIYSFF